MAYYNRSSTKSADTEPVGAAALRGAATAAPFVGSDGGEREKAPPKKDANGRPVSEAKREAQAKQQQRAAIAERNAKAKDLTTGMIEIFLVEDDGTPAAGLTYRVVDSAHREKTGELDGNGYAKVEGLAAGEVTVAFLPRRDAVDGLTPAEAAAGPKAGEKHAAETQEKTARVARQPFEFSVVDENGEPHPNVRWKFEDANGRTFEGRTDQNGAVRVTGHAEGPGRLSILA